MFVNDRAVAFGSRGKTACECQRIDMTAGRVEHAAIPEIAAQQPRCCGAVEKFRREAEAFPCVHAGLRKLHPARRMGRLEPAVLLGLGLDVFITHDGKQNVGAIADQSSKTFARCAVAFGDCIGFRRSHGRNDLSIIAPRCAPADRIAFQQDDALAAFRQMERC